MRQVRTEQKTAERELVSKQAALSARVTELEAELLEAQNRRERSPSPPPPPPQRGDEDGPLMMIQDDVAQMMAEESADELGGEAPIVTECVWWAKNGGLPKAKPCYGKVTTLGHHYHGEIKLCERHVCTAREKGCRLIARPVGYKCSACSRTAEGKEKIKDYDYDRKQQRPHHRRH